jgi:hypothetical protein
MQKDLVVTDSLGDAVNIEFTGAILYTFEAGCGRENICKNTLVPCIAAVCNTVLPSSSFTLQMSLNSSNS